MLRKSPHLRRLCLTFVFLCFLSPFSLPSILKKTAKPLNCLIVTIDTLRADRLAWAGRSVGLTPHLEKLASRSILFFRAFAHTTTTLPSHANIFLGVTPLYHGVHDNANFAVGEEFLTLAEYLKGFGYATGAFIGAYPLDARFGLDQGFDVYDDDYGPQDFEKATFVERPAETVVQRALGWLKEQKGAWFLWVHCFDPHYPYEPPPPFDAMFKDFPYDGEVAYVDFALGSLFDYLEENRILEKTVVVVTGDHGESLGEHGEKTHGFFAYNSTLWVPLIVFSPGLKPCQVTNPVCHIDIFPTVCDLLAIRKPPFLQGISLVSFLSQKEPPKRAIYFESLYPYYSRGWAPLEGVLAWPHKFIDSPLAELYDLETDFSENQNMIGDSNPDKFRQLLAEMKKTLSQSGRATEGVWKRMDRAGAEKLKSLGYVSSFPHLAHRNFGP